MVALGGLCDVKHTKRLGLGLQYPRESEANIDPTQTNVRLKVSSLLRYKGDVSILSPQAHATI